MVKIKINKKTGKIILALALILLTGSFIYAEVFSKPNPGHFMSEINPPEGCSSGQLIQWNGESWVCVNSPIKEDTKCDDSENCAKICISGEMCISSWDAYSPPEEPPICIPLNDPCAGRQCGSQGDGCGKIYDCGDCPSEEYCDLTDGTCYSIEGTGRSCFLKGTRIKMFDGSLKKIEEMMVKNIEENVLEGEIVVTTEAQALENLKKIEEKFSTKSARYLDLFLRYFLYS